MEVSPQTYRGPMPSTMSKAMHGIWLNAPSTAPPPPASRSSGLLNRQEARIGAVQDSAVIGTAKKAVAEPAAPEEIPSNCRYSALSVSGGLKYPQVEQRLRQAWPAFCQGLYGRYSGPLSIEVVLTVRTDGKIGTIALVPKSPLPKALSNAIRDGFKGLELGPLAGQGGARIQLQLQLL